MRGAAGKQTGGSSCRQSDKRYQKERMQEPRPRKGSGAPFSGWQGGVSKVKAKSELPRRER